MWSAIMQMVSGWVAIVAAYFSLIIKDTAVEVIKEVANTPEYAPPTKAQSVATPAEVEEVKIKIRESELWKALHKN